ncbi:NAD-dependent epimerase/dehydratase family protein [Bythopirellula goksoeyrii]|uniref:3 beta-hydroxysteroid dehydrogenase/Delta 5-->4-isomerase n=1 Tax=Bythopirellula goksoeyrii TaxID=1400387 RepID=A0A5B9Q1S6_9BACT|nr:NAD-dependent epimerase/dehydratase family protein [Bythopirellula goksoeyrii]QEG32928.1 3 beta-hydroxysteroid dehydrogenase/Delta 5-->4-isomerase [Bythopirellula goksoeyrii]
MPNSPSSEVSLITGGTGLIGGHLVRRLCTKGQKVRALVRTPNKATWLADLGAELFQGDLFDATSVSQAVEGASHVFHCGGLVSDWGSRQEFHKSNVIGTRNVARAAAAADVHCMVHLSSASVYGYPVTNNITEKTPLSSRNIPYIDSKIQAEQEIRHAIQDDGLRATLLRPVMVFGPECQNYVGEIANHLRSGSMLLLDSGRHIAGLVYVENVVDAILQAAATPAALGQSMNICDDLPVTWKDYIDALADGIGARRVRFSLPTRVAYPLAMTMEAAAKALRSQKRPLLTRLAVLELGQPQVYDISLARRVLGFSPRVSFEDAMSTTLDWINRHL